MSDMIFKAELPIPNSPLATLHVIDYVFLPEKLKLFEETADILLVHSLK